MASKLGRMDFCVNVDRYQLIETLKKNKAQHILEYKQATNNYKVVLSKRLLELEKFISSGIKVDIQKEVREFNIPYNYESTYDEAIEMLEMATGSNIELNADTFTKLVKDEWEWQSGFKTTAMFYNSNV